jgi:hypothetical protein
MPVPSAAAGQARRVPGVSQVKAWSLPDLPAGLGTRKFEASADALNGIGREAIDFGILAFRRRGAMGGGRIVKNAFDLGDVEGAALGQSKEQGFSHGKGRECCSFRLQQSLLLGHAANPANSLIWQDQARTSIASRSAYTAVWQEAVP